MKHTEVKFEDVKVGDTLYIESKGAEYGECNKRTCTVVGINNKAEILCVDFGEGFCGHNADGFVEGNTGYNLWKQDQQYFTLFKVEEAVPETKYTYSGKTKQDKIAKLEAKLERITNKLKTLKESGE